MDDVLMHFGRSKLDGAPGPGSGRYRLGSGKEPYQDYRKTPISKLKERIQESEAKRTQKRAEAKQKEAEDVRRGLKKKKVSKMSDEELRDRIGRIKLEEEYRTLLKSQKGNLRGKAAKLLGEAGEKLAKQSLDKVVAMMVDRIFGEKKFDIRDYKDADLLSLDSETLSKVANWWDTANRLKANKEKFDGKPKKFDIKKYKDADVMKLDPETMAEVSKWWGNAAKITENREKLQSPKEGKESKQSKQPSKDKGSEEPKPSKEDEEPKQPSKDREEPKTSKKRRGR